MSADTYSVLLSPDAQAFVRSLPSPTLEKVAHTIDLLSTTPYLGHAYEPHYEAAPIPIPCRVLSTPDTTVQLYYVIDEKKRTVIVIWAGDARMDPQNRFKY